MSLVDSQLRLIEKVPSGHANDLLQLFQGEWWSKSRSLEDVHRVLENSSITLGLVDDSDRLVAFARVLTDYTYFGFIFDLIVDAELRGRGVGSFLMKRVLEYPALKTVQSLELCCQPEKRSFYEGFGFFEASGRMRFVHSGADF